MFLRELTGRPTYPSYLQEEEVMVRNVLMEKRRNLGRITWHEVQVGKY
jgi:hypothetical protein